MKQAEYAIRTTGLNKKFGTRIAVDNLTIGIRKGEIFSLLGTNGAGKTTTIKMLCCLLDPSGGDARLFDMSIREKPMDIKKIIGVSPQETAIATHLSSRENLILMGGVHGLSSRESRARADDLMGLLEIENRKDRAGKLSGGLQRRLSIAMALMSDPEIIFLDEPTLGLDPHARRSVWKYIEKLRGEKTILLTTHYLEEADSLADNIAIMDKGKIIEMGSPKELKARFTKGHLLRIEGEGIDNSLPVLLRDKGIEAELKNSGLEIVSPDPDYYHIFDLLRSKNVSIRKISTEEPTLDEVFINLTEKEVQP
ncbi:MAG: ATP-binding cassette domain-containing protein [Bacteroidota bacterium]